ncbi:MAG: hypothetical protein IJO02_02565 [Clostridia bacterium]|nr:hypothetical protein [Clostridia bacterium]
MSAKSCFFIGHADSDESILPALESAIEQHITEYGVTEFYVGHHGGFDRLVLRALAAAKSRHPDIRRILVLSYHPAQYIPPPSLQTDELFYPLDMSVPPRFAILKANQAMLSRCSHLICHVWHTGKSRDFLFLAVRRGVHIHNLHTKRT